VNESVSALPPDSETEKKPPPSAFWKSVVSSTTKLFAAKLVMERAESSVQV
jgi:hypothetical protein